MGIYWPLEEQRLAAGGEVLLERLPAAGEVVSSGIVEGGTWAAGRSSLGRLVTEGHWREKKERKQREREKKRDSEELQRSGV